MKTDLVNAEDEEKLYQTYIDIFNGIANHFDQMILSYFCFVDFQEEFTLPGEGYVCLGGAEQLYTDLDTANGLLGKKQEKPSWIRYIRDWSRCCGRWRDYEKYLDLRNEFIARLADEVRMQQEEMLELDIDRLQVFYDQYMREIESCMMYLENNEELMTGEGYSTDSEEYRMMKNAFQESGEALEALFERFRRGEEMSAVDSAFAAEGSVTKFDEAVERSIYYYDQFIRKVNAG